MKLKIGAKLILSFLIIILMSSFIGIIGINQTQRMYANSVEISNNWMKKAEIVGQMNGVNSEYRRYVVQYVLAISRVDRANASLYNEKIDAEIQIFEQYLSQVEELIKTEEGRTLLSNIKTTWESVKEVDNRVINLAQSGNIAAATSLLQSASNEKFSRNKGALQEFFTSNRQNAEMLVTANETTYRYGRIISIVLIVAAFVLGLSFAVFTARGITWRTAYVARTALCLANGDLTVEELPVKSHDEIGDMARAFNQMYRNLKDIVYKINATSNSVAATSEELASNAEEATKATQQVAIAIEEVAKGTSEQSNSISDIVKTVEQVGQAIEQITAGAGEQSKNLYEITSMSSQIGKKIGAMAQSMETVKQISEQNGVVAAKGGQAVEMTVKGILQVKDTVFDTAQNIQEMGEQSQKIGEIIQVIDDIAEQTNLLALNAAIEAARAGEHGKGFAVVADEVRKLAKRSSNATKEIAVLITDVQRVTNAAVESMHVGTKDVEQGVMLANEAGASLSEIVSGVNIADEQVHEVLCIIKEILADSTEIASAINNVAAITQENTAATEEMSASAEEVNATMQNMSIISEESSASAEEVSASTEELTASIEEVSASSEQLSQMAHELKGLVDRFRM